MVSKHQDEGMGSSCTRAETTTRKTRSKKDRDESGSHEERSAHKPRDGHLSSALAATARNCPTWSRETLLALALRARRSEFQEPGLDALQPPTRELHRGDGVVA